MGQSLYLCSGGAGFCCWGLGNGPALFSCKSMGRHCADNNAGAQRYLFSGRFQISGDRGTQFLRAIRLREDHSDEKITHHEVGGPRSETTQFMSEVDRFLTGKSPKCLRL
jgi:hypothetical protein